MKTLIIGFDSAWTARKKGAIVAAIAQPDAQTNTQTYKLLQNPVIVDWTAALGQVRAWTDEHAPDFTKIYIDQPTIVKTPLVNGRWKILLARQLVITTVVCSLRR